MIFYFHIGFRQMWKKTSYLVLFTLFKFSAVVLGESKCNCALPFSLLNMFLCFCNIYIKE